MLSALRHARVLLLGFALLTLDIRPAPAEEDNSLFEAAEDGNVTQIRHCLASGCSINIRDDKEMTPLHHAAMNRKTEAVRELLKQGADANAKDRYGMTPLLYAGMDKAILKALLERGADANARYSWGGTLLQNAILADEPDVAGILLNHGASVYFTPNQTAVDFIRAFPALEEKFRESGVYQRMEDLTVVSGPSPIH